MLKLNDNKIELMPVTSEKYEHLHYLPTSIIIGNAQIPFKQFVKNLCFTLDCHFSMNTHVSNIPFSGQFVKLVLHVKCSFR